MPSSTVATWARTTSPSPSALAMTARPPRFDDISMGRPYCALISRERSSQSRGRHSPLPLPRVRTSIGIAPTKAPSLSQKTPPFPRADRRNSWIKVLVPSIGGENIPGTNRRVHS